MAEVRSTIVPLNEKNYPTWKVQCRMALVKEGQWGIVDRSDKNPGGSQAENKRKYFPRRER